MGFHRTVLRLGGIGHDNPRQSAAACGFVGEDLGVRCLFPAESEDHPATTLSVRWWRLSHEDIGC